MGQDQEQTKRTGWLVFSLLLWTAVFSSVLYTLPKFERMYEEMLAGEPLPFLTQLICRMPLAAYAVTMITGIVCLLWMQHTTSDATIYRRINIAVGLLSILLFIVYVTALFLPLIQLVDALGS